MDTEDNDAMNGDDARNGIRVEWDHTVPHKSGKDITSTNEGGKTEGKEWKLCAMSQNRTLAGVGKASRKKIWGVFKGGRYNKSLVQKKK